MANPLVNFRLDDESKARWEAAAVSQGLPLSAFIRRCVDDVILAGGNLGLSGNALAGGGVEGGSDRAVAAAGAAPAASAKLKPTRGKRSAKKANAETVAAVNRGMCEHRIPADRYCARCDA